VWRRSSSGTSMPHSERMAAGSWGTEAPATAPHSISTPAGASSAAASSSAASPAAWTTTATRSTRVCPSRSMSRPCATAPSALASPKAATTRPASANDPVVSRASSRMPNPNIPIGRTPTSEVSSGIRASGRRSSSR
jgi:hypothetical protein